MEKTEELLRVWLRTETDIRENRILENATMNELIVLGRLSEMPEGMTAGELCQQTNMLKSYMNRVLDKLEADECVVRTQSTRDRRRYPVTITAKGTEYYSAEHVRVLSILQPAVQAMGTEKIAQMIELMNEFLDLFSAGKQTDTEETK